MQVNECGKDASWLRASKGRQARRKVVDKRSINQIHLDREGEKRAERERRPPSDPRLEQVGCSTHTPNGRGSDFKKREEK